MSERPEENTNVTKKDKPKKKFVFAKNRNEAIGAILVMVIFFANSAYMIFNYFVNKN